VPQRTVSALVGSVLLLASAAPGAAQTFDPALTFRVLRTPHFAIYFHQGEARMAERLTTIAEETWTTLARPLGVTPPPLTHVVLADQSEFANGYATPVPYNTIVIYPVWPAGSEWDFEDWLRLAFTHEFTHIVHLDRSEGWARIARNIFGRAFYAFPNVFLPLWQIEGIATYEESVVTGHGRLHAGDYQAIIGEQARTNTLEPLDRINGGVTDWPAGATQYAYGVGFHDYLARRFGADKIAELATATARRFPYTSTKAFEYVYGEPLGDLFREYENSLLESVRPPEVVDSGITRWTTQGFFVTAPRFDRFACAGCPLQLLYSARNPNGFPGLYRLTLDGSPPEHVVDRYLGNTTGIARDAIYFDQLERRRNVGLYSDLYVLSRADGSVRKLTSEARLLDPDVSPDGSTIVCTENRPGQRSLVLIRLKDAGAAPGSAPRLAPLVAEAGVFFDAPRWSPDGRTIAAERHREGALPEIALVDVATKAVRVLASDARTRFTMPAWRPDGAAVVAAAAPEEETFNLVELPLDRSGARQLTHMTGGALWPDVSPDGRTIVFAGYTTAGYDLFSMPYPRADSETVEHLRGVDPQRGDVQQRRDAQQTVDTHGEERQANASASSVPAPSAATYNPLATLAPTSWTPTVVNDGVAIRLGGVVSGVDVLGYHTYSAQASWLVATSTDAPVPSRALPDWQVYYEYDRWRPRFYATASLATSFAVGPPTAAGTASDSTLRETSLEGGVFYPILHARARHAGQASIVRAHSDFTLPGGPLTRSRTALRGSWQTITARSYGYSISREDGVGVGATIEAVRRALGSDADATTYTADARAYLHGVLPHHVVALRFSGGASDGDPTVGRTFVLGGSTAAGVADFSSRASSLLRGFPDATFAGTRVALANAEYRFPIYRLQRGFGTWPILFHTFHGAVFGDAGETWSTAFHASDLKTSIGVEASSDVVVAYFAPITIAAGAALGHDRSGLVRDRATLYVRIGKSF
jgi:Tol biopolymer transport system component